MQGRFFVQFARLREQYTSAPELAGTRPCEACWTWRRILQARRTAGLRRAARQLRHRSPAGRGQVTYSHRPMSRLGTRRSMVPAATAIPSLPSLA